MVASWLDLSQLPHIEIESVGAEPGYYFNVQCIRDAPGRETRSQRLCVSTGRKTKCCTLIAAKKVTLLVTCDMICHLEYDQFIHNILSVISMYFLKCGHFFGLAYLIWEMWLFFAPQGHHTAYQSAQTHTHTGTLFFWGELLPLASRQ